MNCADLLRSCGKLPPPSPPSTFPQPPQLRRPPNVLPMSLDDSVTYLHGSSAEGDCPRGRAGGSRISQLASRISTKKGGSRRPHVSLMDLPYCCQLSNIFM